MVEKRRTESALTRRPLKDRVIDQGRQLAGVAEERAPSACDAPGFELDVSSSLETIHRVTQTYAVLLDKLSSYELKVRELTQSAADATQARADALRDLAKNERLLKEERDRAAQAEEQADHSAEMVRELERQLTSLRSQTSKLMNAVDQLFPDIDDGSNDGPRGLRVVR